MKIRKQTYSLSQYLKLMNAETICTDQECQRLSGQWNNNMAGKLIATVLTDNYIPPIILGEEVVSGITRLWVIDPDQYKGKTLQNFKWLNENTSISDFEQINALLTRLTDSINATKDIKALFNSKHAHILAATFKAFAESGHEDKEFGNFLDWFVNGGNETVVDGKNWDMLNADRSTRDIGTVHGKLAYLETLMKQYFEEISKAA